MGDPIYNAGSQADRGYLHAFALSFPYQNEQYQFVCDPREFAILGEKWQEQEIQQGIQAWLQPWQLAWPTIKK